MLLSFDVCRPFRFLMKQMPLSVTAFQSRFEHPCGLLHKVTFWKSGGTFVFSQGIRTVVNLHASEIFLFLMSTSL